jgi:hypothetical protein
MRQSAVHCRFVPLRAVQTNGIHSIAKTFARKIRGLIRRTGVEGGIRRRRPKITADIELLARRLRTSQPLSGAPVKRGIRSDSTPADHSKPVIPGCAYPGHPAERGQVPEAEAQVHHPARLTMMIQVVNDMAMIRDTHETDGRMRRRVVGTMSRGWWRCVVMSVVVEDEGSVWIDGRARRGWVGRAMGRQRRGLDGLAVIGGMRSRGTRGFLGCPPLRSLIDALGDRIGGVNLPATGIGRRARTAMGRGRAAGSVVERVLAAGRGWRAVFGLCGIRVGSLMSARPRLDCRGGWRAGAGVILRPGRLAPTVNRRSVIGGV